MRTFPILAALALVAAACGGSSEGHETATPAPTPTSGAVVTEPTGVACPYEHNTDPSGARVVIPNLIQDFCLDWTDMDWSREHRTLRRDRARLSRP